MENIVNKLYVSPKPLIYHFPFKIKHSNVPIYIPSWTKEEAYINIKFNSLLKNEFSDYELIFRDDSKMDENVGCPFDHVTTNYYKKFKISKDCSIFSAEAIAILRALVYIDSSDKPKKIFIVSDSQSVLKSIQNFYKTKSENYLIYKICDIMCKINKIVEFLWCPSHVGIQPNEFVDSLAKQAITDGLQ